MKTIIDFIGNTPLVPFEKDGVKLYLKMEQFNPGGSVKDRIAKAMIKDAIEKGKITSKTVVIEPTSGNTGIGLAMVCAVLRISLTLVMPESMSIERRKILEMYGAKLILTPAEKGMSGAIEKAEFLASVTSNSFIPYQFKNPANPAIHYTTTGPEIYNSMQSEVDVLVAGVGTGGTISGVGKFMKEKNPNTFVIALEPYDSPVLSGGKPRPHKIQGIGAGFIPDILNLSIIDEVITIKYEDAFETAKMLASYGIFCGISSGANVYGALQVAKRPKFKDKKIVTFICDTGERYLSNFMSN